LSNTLFRAEKAAQDARDVDLYQMITRRNRGGDDVEQHFFSAQNVQHFRLDRIVFEIRSARELTAHHAPGGFIFCIFADEEGSND
jgi:hypothetical protein